MDFLEEIKKLSDDELEKVIDEKIKVLEKESLELNPDSNIIGYHLNYNPDDYRIMNFDDEELTFGFDVSCFTSGYIRKGCRMVYGFCYDDLGIVSNNGSYYDIDTEDYVYDFCKYIKDKDISSEYELFDYILDYIKNYIGHIKNIDRDEMFKMIWRGYRTYYPPENEHAFSWFRGQGNGMCTEYSLMAQNILELFDIDSSLIIGKVNTDDEDEEFHAFNIISFVDKETNEEIELLIDFANCVEVYDLNFNNIGYSPYIMDLTDLSDEEIDDFIYNGKHLTCDDFDYLVFGDSFVQISYDRERDYYIPNDIIDYGGIIIDEEVQFNKRI